MAILTIALSAETAWLLASTHALRSVRRRLVNRSDSGKNLAATVPLESLEEGRALVLKIRRAGFTLGLDEKDSPRIVPLALLTAPQRDLLRKHREAIRLALLSERKPSCLLTPFDLPPWEDLAAWWLAWTPPTEPYELTPGVVVSDPAFTHAYHADLIRLGCSGQVQLALFDWLKRHAIKFGVKIRETSEERYV